MKIFLLLMFSSLGHSAALANCFYEGKILSRDDVKLVLRLDKNLGDDYCKNKLGKNVILIEDIKANKSLNLDKVYKIKKTRFTAMGPDGVVDHDTWEIITP